MSSNTLNKIMTAKPNGFGLSSPACNQLWRKAGTFAVFLNLLAQLNVVGQGTNYVLDLVGTNSFVELTTHLFTNEVVTVEGWMSFWDSSEPYSMFALEDSALQIGL